LKMTAWKMSGRSQAWWLMHISQLLGRLRQTELKPNQGNIVMMPCQK
jgi:hypothetical protein